MKAGGQGILEWVFCHRDSHVFLPLCGKAKSGFASPKSATDNCALSNIVDLSRPTN